MHVPPLFLQNGATIVCMRMWQRFIAVSIGAFLLLGIFVCVHNTASFGTQVRARTNIAHEICTAPGVPGSCQGIPNHLYWWETIFSGIPVGLLLLVVAIVLSRMPVWIFSRRAVQVCAGLCQRTPSRARCARLQLLTSRLLQEAFARGI